MKWSSERLYLCFPSDSEIQRKNSYHDGSEVEIYRQYLASGYHDSCNCYWQSNEWKRHHLSEDGTAVLEHLLRVGEPRFDGGLVLSVVVVPGRMLVEGGLVGGRIEGGHQHPPMDHQGQPLSLY